MNSNEYFVEGTVTKAGKARKFIKKIHANSEKLATEKALSLIGAENRVRRQGIKITNVEKA